MSVQNVSSTLRSWRSFRSGAEIFTDKVAFTSYILGIVMYLMGDPRAFPISRQQLILPV